MVSTTRLFKLKEMFTERFLVENSDDYREFDGSHGKPWMSQERIMPSSLFLHGRSCPMVGLADFFFQPHPPLRDYCFLTGGHGLDLPCFPAEGRATAWAGFAIRALPSPAFDSSSIGRVTENGFAENDRAVAYLNSESIRRPSTAAPLSASG